MMFCRMCGREVPDNAKFCPACGTNLKPTSAGQGNAGAEFAQATDKKGSWRQQVDNLTSTINNLAGESGEVKINLRDLYSEVGKRHAASEQAKLLISGINTEELSVKDMATTWPKPWFYSRVFVILGLCFLGLVFILHVFGNPNVLPAIMFVGSLVVPFSILTLFWETNIPRNISIFFVIVLFLVGGVASLIPTLFGYSIVGGTNFGLMGAISIGIIEEIGKAIIVIYLINAKKYKYILNGLLIGACIGAGFAVFESAGYAFRFLIVNPRNFERLIYLRAFTSIGTHLMWTAMVGAGYIATGKVYNQPNFLKFLGIAIALHAAWDWSGFPLPQWVKLLLLSVLAWIIVLTLVSSGLKQIERLSNGNGGNTDV